MKTKDGVPFGAGETVKLWSAGHVHKGFLSVERPYAIEGPVSENGRVGDNRTLGLYYIWQLYYSEAKAIQSFRVELAGCINHLEQQIAQANEIDTEMFNKHERVRHEQ